MKKNKVRAPRPLISKGYCYAGINWHPTIEDEMAVYIGGTYYSSPAQIHLTESQVIRLSKWLNKAAEYFKDKGEI